jgi:hypothetical protein
MFIKKGGSDINYNPPCRKIAFLFLTLDNPNFPDIWEQYLAGNENKISVYIHPKFPEKTTWRAHCIIEDLHETEWGNIVNAYKSLFRAALKDRNNYKFITISESCIPIKPFAELYADITNSNVSLIKSMNISKYDMNARISPEIISNIGRTRIIKHYARMCLSRKHATQITASPHLELFTKIPVGDEFFLSSISPLHDVDDTEITFDDWEDTKDVLSRIRKKITLLRNNDKNTVSAEEKLWDKFDALAGRPKTIIKVSKKDLTNMRDTDAYFYRKFAVNSDIPTYINEFI